MSNKPWIRLIWPAYRYRSSGRNGHRYVRVKEKCCHRSKNPELAARSVMMYKKNLKLYIDDLNYEFPYKGVGYGSTYSIDYLGTVEDHIRHCIELHKAFFNEQN